MTKDTNIPFIGRGWKFPPEFDNIHGEVRMSEGNDDIRESIEILLSTYVGERLLNPKYGCDLSILFFESLTVSKEKFLKDKIETALLRYEPRIKVLNIQMTNKSQQGRIEIDIEYLIKTTNSRSNMVYPFYLNEGTNL